MKKIIALIAAISIIFTFAACGAKPDNAQTTAPAEAPAPSETVAPAEAFTLESGVSTLGNKDDYNFAYYLEIISRNGNTVKYGVYTKSETLGDSLYSIGVIDGEEGPYGLMVESVFGEEHIYETSGFCWMIYVNGEQAQTGVDSIKLENGATYTFKVETF